MAVVPTPRTWSTNEDVTSSNMNSGIKDPLSFLLNKPVAQLRQTVAQTLTTAVSAAITFTTEDEDSENGHSTSSNTSRLAAVYAGLYWVSGAVVYTNNATGARYAWLRVNGSDLAGSMASLPTVNASDFAGVILRPRLVRLAVGDYIELVGHQTSGGNLDTVVSPARNQSTLSMTFERN